jgi:hypothetical protein
MIRTGFNFGRSGLQLIKQQIASIDTLAQRKGDISDLYMRFTSGTGLYSHPDIIDSSEVRKGYVDSQKKHGWKTIWGLGGKSLDAQISSLTSYLNEGLIIEAFYLGNEQYWKAKYNVTPQQYIAWCEQMITAFQSYNLPFLINIAPAKAVFHNQWNQAIFNFVAVAPDDIVIQPDLHVYTPTQSFPWQLFDQVRAAFPNKKLWVSEYGAQDDAGGSGGTIELELWVTSEIRKRLVDEDVMISHMLANNFTSPGDAQAWINNGQWRPKGNAMYDLLYPTIIVEPEPEPIIKPIVLDKVTTTTGPRMWQWTQTLVWSDGTMTVRQKTNIFDTIRFIGGDEVGKLLKEQL